MADPKGYHLYVNIGPSQARRRLKSFGHGVRKVQSAGRNQSVIIHTATGRHLSELEAKFADVGFASSFGTLSEPIENLRNLGPTSSRWLRDVGIDTIARLRQVGPLAAFRLVKQAQSGTSTNLLWAMVAGLRDADWRTLSDDEKQTLLAELDAD